MKFKLSLDFFELISMSKFLGRWIEDDDGNSRPDGQDTETDQPFSEDSHVRALHLLRGLVPDDGHNNVDQSGIADRNKIMITVIVNPSLVIGHLILVLVLVLLWRYCTVRSWSRQLWIQAWSSSSASVFCSWVSSVGSPSSLISCNSFEKQKG